MTKMCPRWIKMCCNTDSQNVFITAPKSPYFCTEMNTDSRFKNQLHILYYAYTDIYFKDSVNNALYKWLFTSGVYFVIF